MRRRPIVFTFVCQPADTPTLSRHPRPTRGSLASNRLCGLYYSVRIGQHKGTYTTEGITKLCEVLKGSAVTSLKCAVAP